MPDLRSSLVAILGAVVGIGCGSAPHGSSIVEPAAASAIPAADVSDSTLHDFSLRSSALIRSGGTAVEKSVVVALLLVDCGGTGPIASPAASFTGGNEGLAVFANEDGKLSTLVVALGATPNASYQIGVVETPNGPCAQTTMTTGPSGDGIAAVSMPLASGAQGAFAFAYALPAGGPPLDVAATVDVSFAGPSGAENDSRLSRRSDVSR
jgi:hypothetical protein